jgi:hypothetical protein
MISNTLVASSFSAGGGHQLRLLRMRAAQRSSIIRSPGAMLRAAGGPPLFSQFEIVAG